MKGLQRRVLPVERSSQNRLTLPRMLTSQVFCRAQRWVGTKCSVCVSPHACDVQLETQLLRLSETTAMPLSMRENQLSVTFQLLKEVRKSSPQCLLVPFGSVITGLATRHSDADLCLVPNPPAPLVRILTGTSYFSPGLLSVVESLESKYGVPLCPPVTPVSGEGQYSCLATACNLSRTQRVAAFGPLLRQLRAHVDNMDGCSHVLSLPNARCPIVRFRHDPTSLDFDVCIENM